MRKQVYNLTTDKIEVLKDFMADMSLEELEKYSLFPVEYGSKPDPRFYSYTESKAFNNTTKVYEITYTPVAKDLTGLKEMLINQVKEVQTKKLSEIDWYWFREQKIGTPVPQDIQDLATSIYTTATTIEGEIAALVDVAALELYVATPYDVVEDELDINLQPTGNTVTITRYKNNVTDW